MHQIGGFHCHASWPSSLPSAPSFHEHVCGTRTPTNSADLSLWFLCFKLFTPQTRSQRIPTRQSIWKTTLSFLLSFYDSVNFRTTCQSTTIFLFFSASRSADFNFGTIFFKFRSVFSAPRSADFVFRTIIFKFYSFSSTSQSADFRFLLHRHVWKVQQAVKKPPVGEAVPLKTNMWERRSGRAKILCVLSNDFEWN